MKPILVIPALNEETTIAKVIGGSRERIADILVVDDGSMDSTSAKAASMNARVIRHPRNIGKGAALKTGFDYGLRHGYDWVFTLDGDGQHDPRDIESFFPLLDRYDIVLGDRMTEAGIMPPIRWFANRLSSAIASALAGCRIHDSQTGFRAYKAEVLGAVKLTTQRFETETEILIRAGRQGFRIGHCQIRTIYGKEKSRFRVFGDSLRFARLIAVLLRLQPADRRTSSLTVGPACHERRDPAPRTPPAQ